jgi:phenylalanyl-tRNA synthetase beta chain
MKISLNQIRKYTDIKLTEDELIDRIKSGLGEVEHVLDLKEKYKGVLVGEIAEKANHPKSEKLKVYQVNIGKETLQVLAGGPELEVGNKIAYLTVGSVVPHNASPSKFDGVIRKAKLGGLESNGMMASARELDFSNDHEKVMVLETDAKAGTPLTEALGLDDKTLDIENKALTNRPDLFGHIGIAREVAGLQGIQYKTPEWYTDATINRPDTLSNETHKVTVENNAEALCYRYMIVAIKDINIAPSPLWLQTELVKAGMRPVNNIVDITNFMMIDSAQPMHAFDYDRVVAKDPNATDTAHIVIRPGKNGETMTTLDGKNQTLDDNVIMICDSTSPIAVGGVMGGLDTEITDDTKNILLEVANFDMYSIRKTSMKLGLASDAVSRYARGQDQNQCETTMYKAIKMIEELTGGTLASNVIDNYPIRITPWDIEVSIERLNMHLGTELTKDEIKGLLEKIELEIVDNDADPDEIIVKIPTYRRDLRIREDIHEDIARLIGFDNIKLSYPSRSISPAANNELFELRHHLRTINQQLGANEILTYNFVNADTYKKIGLSTDQMHHLINSLSPELEYMRTILTPSILDKVSANIRKGNDEFALYEINKAHNKVDMDTENLPIEFNNIALVVTDDKKGSKLDQYGSPYYLAKHYLSELLDTLGISNVAYRRISEVEIEKLPNWMQNALPLYKQSNTAIVSVSKEQDITYLGFVGEYNNQAHKVYKLPAYTAGYEINIDSFINLVDKDSKYVEPSRFPATINDITVKVPVSTATGDIQDSIMAGIADQGRQVGVDIVDIYQPENNELIKHVTFRIKIQSSKKTLESDDVKYILSSVTADIKDQFGAEVI